MRKSHFGKTQQVVGPFHNRWVKSERSADDELDMAGAMHSKTVDFLRKFFTGQLLAFDGERDDERIVANMLGDAFAFSGLDLSVNAFGGMVRRFLICHFNDVE